MALYRVHFVDHGGNIYGTQDLEHDEDEDAIEEAHRRNVPSIGGGFEVWQDDRLIHKHRN